MSELEPESAAAPEIGPTAGIVRTEADTVLEALEAEEHHARERERYFEGRRLTNEDRHRAIHFLGPIMRELNQRLVACNFSLREWHLEHMGLGIRVLITLRGTHTATVDYRFGDEQRARLWGTPTLGRDDRLPLDEAFGRQVIAEITDAMFVEDARYRSRAGIA